MLVGHIRFEAGACLLAGAFQTSRRLNGEDLAAAAHHV